MQTLSHMYRYKVQINHVDVQLACTVTLYTCSCLYVRCASKSDILFSSPEPKAQVSFSDHNLSVVLIVVVNFSHFHLLLQNHWTNFNQSRHKASLDEVDFWVKGIQVCSSEVPCLFPRGDNNEIAKVNWRNFKNLLIQDMWANFNQTWHNAYLGKGFQDCSNKGPCPCPRVDHYEIVNIHWHNFKKSSLTWTTCPNSCKLSTKHLWVIGIQVCLNEGPTPFPRGENYEIAKIHWQNS